MTNRLKVSFDLASIQSGYCFAIVDDDNEIKNIIYDSFVLEKYETKNFYENFNKLTNIVNQIKKLKEKNNCTKIDIAVELANFGAAKIVNRFNFISGMLISIFYNTFKADEINFKFFAANEWFKHYGDLSLDTYNRKKTVYNFCCEKLNKRNFNNFDITDAIGINFVMDLCLDQFDTWEENKIKKKNLKIKKISKTKKLLEINNKTAKYNLELSELILKEKNKPLTVKQKLRKEELIREIENLKIEKQKLKSKNEETEHQQ